jgi:hypothetical protein
LDGALLYPDSQVSGSPVNQTVNTRESACEVFRSVFSVLKPRTAGPPVEVEFCRFARANSSIRLQNGQLLVRITDALQGAPTPVMEALAHILLSKLYRLPRPKAHIERYRRHLNGSETRDVLRTMQQQRGRKLAAPAKGNHYHLEAIFDDLNLRFFGGSMAKPSLGWSLRTSRSTLGHYDPAHHAIVLNPVLDRTGVPKLAVEFVMFHEMLHIRHPVEHRGSRRCIHTPEFKAAERQFPGYAEAKKMLKMV